MAKAEEIQVIVELTHHTLHALRAVNGTAEAGGECVLDNGPALEALLGAVAPSGNGDGIEVGSVWPDGAAWHLSSETEAVLDRAPEALRAIAGATQGESKYPFSYAACGADDGGAITPEGTAKWILAHCHREELARAGAGAERCRVPAGGAAPAAFARAGAIARALRAAGKGCVALWDLGSERSHLLLVTPGGVAGVAPCSIGLNAAYEAVQAALKLKFRGAGARLFFNEGYDFSEPGPRIGAILGESLKRALALLPRSEAPPELACIGLTGKQAWFVREVAKAAGASAWSPDMKALAGYFGLTFADDAVQASFSPMSIGAFELLSLRLGAKAAWSPAWVEAEAPEAEVPVEAEKPAPVEEPAPAPARPKPVLTPEGGPAPPIALRQPKQPAAPKQEAAAPVAAPEAPAPAARPAAPSVPIRPPAPPAFSQTAFAPPPEPAAAHGGSAASPPPFPFPAAPAAKPAAAPVPGAPGAIRTSASTAPADAAAEPQEPEAKSKVGFYVGVIAAGALVFAGIAVALDYRMQKIKESDLEQQEALAHHLAEVRVREAALARSEPPEPPTKEPEAVAAVAPTPAQDTRPERPAFAQAPRPAVPPGAIAVATAPAGASVSIDGAAPLASPARAEGIAPGTHRVRIALAGHDSVELSAEVRSSRTTDLGTVKLKSSFGSLEISSSPDGLGFQVSSAADPAGKPVYSGRTPARITDVQRGDYFVTFSRPGCHDHVESATVAKGATTPVETKYLDGSLELASDPSGAWVEKDGMRLGSTPLVLHDLTPKVASFELTLPGYDPTPISCDIPEGQTLKVTAHLLRRDRVFEASEVKTLPASYESPAPELSPGQADMNAEALLSFVVQRDGTVIDIKVEKSTDDDIGRRCATALAKWRFHPATAADDRPVDVRMEMPFKFPAASK